MISQDSAVRGQVTLSARAISVRCGLRRLDATRLDDGAPEPPGADRAVRPLEHVVRFDEVVRQTRTEAAPLRTRIERNSVTSCRRGNREE
jgi:hypothetical protein